MMYDNDGECMSRPCRGGGGATRDVGQAITTLRLQSLYDSSSVSKAASHTNPYSPDIMEHQHRAVSV